MCTSTVDVYVHIHRMPQKMWTYTYVSTSTMLLPRYPQILISAMLARVARVKGIRSSKRDPITTAKWAGPALWLKERPCYLRWRRLMIEASSARLSCGPLHCAALPRGIRQTPVAGIAGSAESGAVPWRSGGGHGTDDAVAPAIMTARLDAADRVSF